MAGTGDSPMDSNTVTDDEALRQTIKAFHGDGFFAALFVKS